MITTVVTVTSTFLAGTFGAAAVASLILFLIMRELTSAHAEETGSPRSRILSHTLLVPIAPLLVAFTFLVLITAWIIYTTYMSVLPAETKSIMFLNVALLLLVALVPYLLNSVELVNPALSPAESSALRNYSSTLFTVDLAGIMVILAAFAHVISLEEKKLVARDLAELFRNGRNRLVVLAVLVAVSIAPQFWEWTLLGVPTRLYVWYVPLVSYWVGRVLRPASRTYRRS